MLIYMVYGDVGVAVDHGGYISAGTVYHSRLWFECIDNRGHHQHILREICQH